MVSDHEDRSLDLLDTHAIVSLCDRVIGEAGRRRHMFSWLRTPGSETGQWLAVDAYYPGNRLVVVCGEHSAEDDDLYAELVPAHGLRLLRTDEAELGADPVAAEGVLRRRIADLALPPRPTGSVAGSSDRERHAGPGTLARMAMAFAQGGAGSGGRAQPAVGARRPGPPRPGPRRPGPRPTTHSPQVEAAGVAAGLALAVIVCAELYVGVGLVALEGGHWLLAFGIAMDACARVLGAIAAGRSGRTEWVWWCVIIGSPAVVRCVLYDEDGPLTTEPAPLAAVLAILALSAVAVAVGVAILGL